MTEEIKTEVIEDVKEIIEEVIPELKTDVQSEDLLGKINEIIAENVLPVISDTINALIGKDVIKKLSQDKSKKNSIKDWLQEPQISLSHILVFVIIVIWNVISNSTLFSGDGSIWNMCITFGSYFGIMALKRRSGVSETGVFGMFKSIIDIIVSGDSNDNKIKRLESVLLTVTRALGDLYEDELNAITEYLKTTKN